MIALVAVLFLLTFTQCQCLLVNIFNQQMIAKSLLSASSSFSKSWLSASSSFIQTDDVEKLIDETLSYQERCRILHSIDGLDCGRMENLMRDRDTSSRHFKCTLYSSIFDDIDENGQTNINDKFWRIASSISIDGDGRACGLQPTSSQPKLGPFTVTSSHAEPTFYVTLPIVLGIIRYSYQIEKGEDVNLLEFQWVVGGKIIYNRLIGRKEKWRIRLNRTKISSSSNRDVIIIEVSHKYDNVDGCFDRILCLQPSS